jgi:hypothetical protein
LIFEAVTIPQCKISVEENRLEDLAGSKRVKSSFMGDCPKVWNAAPNKMQLGSMSRLSQNKKKI